MYNGEIHMNYQFKTSKISLVKFGFVLSLGLFPATTYGAAAPVAAAPSGMAKILDVATSTVQGAGNAVLLQAGLFLQLGSMAAAIGVQGAKYAVGHFPKTSLVAGLYVLAADNGKNARMLGTAIQKLGLDILAAASLRKATETPGKAVEHLEANNNAATAATLLAYFIIKYTWDETCEWIGDNKITEKFIVMAKEAPLANWCYGSHKHACSIYQDFMYDKDDSLLRKELIQEYESGSINGWKFKEGDIQSQLLGEITRERKVLLQLKEEATYYIPNGKLTLKLCRDYAGIFDRRRWCSTVDKEDIYCALILKDAFPMKDGEGKVISGPDKAKANSWHELFWKDDYNIFWRRYRYWSKALLLYAEIENRLERLEALELIVKYELPKWWPIFIHGSAVPTVSIPPDPAILAVSGNPVIVIENEQNAISEQTIVA
jgi:hypothetical protein